MKAVNIAWDIDEILNTASYAINLPTEIDIPKDLTELEEISDYLSDVTGFCHYGFYLED